MVSVEDTNVVLMWDGLAGSYYVVETSTNTSNWYSCAFTSGNNQPIVWIDNCDQPNKFYRLRVLSNSNPIQIGPIQPNQIVQIPAGVYSLTNAIDFAVGARIEGDGKWETFILSYVPLNTSPAFNLQSDCELSKLQIIGALDSYQAGIGLRGNLPAFTNALVREVITRHDTDGYYVRHAKPCYGVAEDCSFNARWDSVALFQAAHVLEACRTSFTVSGQSQVDPVSGALENNAIRLSHGSTLVLHDCTVTATRHPRTNNAINLTGLNGPLAEVHTSHVTSASNGWDAINLNGGTLLFVASVVDSNKVAGPATYQ